MEQPQCLLVGCGMMGNALKQGWERTQASLTVTVIEPGNPRYLPGLSSLPENYVPNVVVFAVKPQIIPQLLPLYHRFTEKGCLFISIAAGVTLSTYHTYLGKEESVIRAMPNLAATVGQGMTALVSQNTLEGKKRLLGEAIFNGSGKTLWLDQESLMDAITAVSGSGPAYFFRMVECLASAGMACGLPPEIAMELARQTAIGAGEMLHSLPDAAVDLRLRVTSPGGTTAAALTVLDHGNALADLIRTAVKAAARRALELSQ